MKMFKYSVCFAGADCYGLVKAKTKDEAKILVCREICGGLVKDVNLDNITECMEKNSVIPIHSEYFAD